MATASTKRRVKDNLAAVAVAVTLLGYALVVGTLYVGLPIYPEISLATVNLLSHAIAVVNAITVVLLALGWRFIRRGEVRKHRVAMTAAFSTIMLFLVLYLLKTGGGGRKEFVGPALARDAYFAMLGIHVFLSILSVPVVVYALLLGLTHTPAELRDTPHATVGRVAASAWMLSLALGIGAYVALNHLYSWEFVDMMVTFL